VYPSAVILGYSESAVAMKQAAAVMYTPVSSDMILSKTNEYFHIKHDNEKNSIYPTGYVQSMRLLNGHEVQYLFYTQLTFLFQDLCLTIKKKAARIERSTSNEL
jgi:hypothetical protein